MTSSITTIKQQQSAAALQWNAAHTEITFLSWDSEGTARCSVNLLRTGCGVGIETQRDGNWHAAPAIDFEAVQRTDGFDLVLGGDANNVAAAGGTAYSLLFPFSPTTSSTTVIPSGMTPEGGLLLPAVVSSPLCGPMQVQSAGGERLICSFEGSRDEQWLNWRIVLPAEALGAGITLQFRSLQLAPPRGLLDNARWRQVRRAWLNQWQVSANWGNQAQAFSAPPGVLANNVLSDPVSSCLFIYADAALLTPQLAPGVSVLPALARTLDWFLDERTQESGQVISYYDHLSFLDSNPSLLIAAWDYHEAGGDPAWIEARLAQLEKVADYMAARDVDGDGIVEALPSGDANSLHDPMRPSNGYDCINFGHKDAYSNILIYRAWRCMADLERQMGRAAQSARYAALADKLKAAYFATFYNPESGRLIGWISRDGVSHDYAFTFVNCAAVEYGLVEPDRGRAILSGLRRAMADKGFVRFDIGMPWSLLPILRADYLQGPTGYGVPQREDGSDTFGQFCNGGVFPGDGLRLMAAYYAVGQEAEGDAILDAMLARVGHGDIGEGGFACGIVNAFPRGGEMFDWQGNTTGYEGMLSHAWYFVQGVALREAAVRERLYRPLRSGGAAQSAT